MIRPLSFRNDSRPTVSGFESEARRQITCTDVSVLSSLWRSVSLSLWSCRIHIPDPLPQRHIVIVVIVSVVISSRGFTFPWWGCYSLSPFYSILVSISLFMAISTVFQSINSSDNSPISYLVSHSGELRTKKLKSHLVRTQSLKVLPLKPGVGQYIAIHATLTARDFFLAYFYPSGPFIYIFPNLP